MKLIGLPRLGLFDWPVSVIVCLWFPTISIYHWSLLLVLESFLLCLWVSWVIFIGQWGPCPSTFDPSHNYIFRRLIIIAACFRLFRQWISLHIRISRLTELGALLIKIILLVNLFELSIFYQFFHYYILLVSRNMNVPVLKSASHSQCPVLMSLAWNSSSQLLPFVADLLFRFWNNLE